MTGLIFFARTEVKAMKIEDSAKAFVALMQETPYSHFDSGSRASRRNAAPAVSIVRTGNISPVLSRNARIPPKSLSTRRSERKAVKES